MTKKHFIVVLAELVRETEPFKLNQKDARASAEHQQWELMRDALAEFCVKQNPRFLRGRWLSYISEGNDESMDGMLAGPFKPANTTWKTPASVGDKFYATLRKLGYKKNVEGDYV